MFKILLIIALSWSTMFIFLNHPLTFGVTLLAQTIVVSMITGLMSPNFWFSYILFLIMVGGMLILFIYMTSVASNEKFKLSLALSMSIIMFMVIMISSMFIDPLFFNQFLNYELIPEPKSMNFSMSKYMNFPSNMIMLLMITYLLISLIMVVKITNIEYGPLRQKF